MNGQPSEIYGVLGVIIFGSMVLFFMFKEMKHPTKKKPMSYNDWDMINLGVVQPNKPTPTPKPKPTRAPRTTKMAKPKPAKPVNPIFNDCVSALVGLGFPKRKAVAAANNIFEEFNPTTIEEFVKIAFRK